MICKNVNFNPDSSITGIYFLHFQEPEIVSLLQLSHTAKTQSASKSARNVTSTFYRSCLLTVTQHERRNSRVRTGSMVLVNVGQYLPRLPTRLIIVAQTLLGVSTAPNIHEKRAFISVVTMLYSCRVVGHR